jgi:hypothetical protein
MNLAGPRLPPLSPPPDGPRGRERPHVDLRTWGHWSVREKKGGLGDFLLIRLMASWVLLPVGHVHRQAVRLLDWLPLTGDQSASTAIVCDLGRRRRRRSLPPFTSSTLQCGGCGCSRPSCARRSLPALLPLWPPISGASPLFCIFSFSSVCPSRIYPHPVCNSAAVVGLLISHAHSLRHLETFGGVVALPDSALKLVRDTPPPHARDTPRHTSAESDHVHCCCCTRHLLHRRTQNQKRHCHCPWGVT